MNVSNSLIPEKPQTGPPERIRPGTYLTDGANLYRVTSVTSGSRGPKVIELEDCRTLEASVHDSKALGKLGLVTVTPANDG